MAQYTCTCACEKCIGKWKLREETPALECIASYPRGFNMKAVEALPVVYRHRPFSRYLHATACSFRNVMKSKKAKHLPSTSQEALNKIKTNRGKKSTKMSKGAAEQREAIVSDRERRRRTLDPLVWDAKTAEIMLLYKDGEFVGPFPNRPNPILDPIIYERFG